MSKISEISVFGANEFPDPTNIGAAIAATMREQHDYIVHTTDCAVDMRMHTFAAPHAEDWPYDESEAAVISIGKSDSRAIQNASVGYINDMLRSNLGLPLEIASKWLNARKANSPSEESLGGKLIFIGSYGHDHPFTQGTLYTAAKAGLHMATRNIAWETSSKGFETFIVHPYHVPGTPMWEDVMIDVEDREGCNRVDAERMARKDMRLAALSPFDVAQVVANLLENDWKHLSGSSIDLYGGVR